MCGLAIGDDRFAHPIYRETDPRSIRGMIRHGEWAGNTRHIGVGLAQANLIVVPRSDAYDLLLFCQRNPAPCSLLEVTEPGDPEPRLTSPGGDIRTDLPKYRVFRRGEFVDEVTDVRTYWRDDLVGFLIGCMMTLESALVANGVPVRKLEEMSGPCMFKTNIPCHSAGRMMANMVVSMMTIPAQKVVRAIQVTSRYPAVHGSPVHIGDPSAIGIQDITRPDWGKTPAIKPGDVPVFWGCGMTPQLACIEARVEIQIGHAPGCMLITDVRDEQLAII